MGAELFSIPLTALSEMATPSSQGVYLFFDSENSNKLTSIDPNGMVVVYSAGIGPQTLANTLLIGKKTNELSIESNNGSSFFNVFDASASLNFVLGPINGQTLINATETKISHTAKVSFDSLLYNFTNLAVNSALGIDALGNLYTFVLPTDNQNLFEVLTQGNKTGELAITSDNTKSSLSLFNANTILSYHNGASQDTDLIIGAALFSATTIDAINSSVSVYNQDGFGFLQTYEDIGYHSQFQIGTGVILSGGDITTNLRGQLNVNSNNAQLYYFDTTTRGTILFNTTHSYLYHDTLISFDAPIYHFEQLTATTIPFLDASKNLVSSSITPTELNELSGVSSNIQTQFNNIALTYVPLSRFININGNSQDLGADRVYTITTTGTANRISVTGGATITPTIDISLSYIGQTSITQLGTITTGVWNGSIIPIAFGGTNSSTALVNNKIMVSSLGSIVEHTAQTSSFVSFYDALGLPSGDLGFRWNNTSKTLGVGAVPGALDKVSITSTGLIRGLFVTSANKGAAISTTHVSEYSLLLDNSSLAITPIDIFIISNTGHAATIGSGSYQLFNDVTASGSATFGKFGVLSTDISAGTYKSKFVWQTPDQLTGAIVSRMELSSNAVLTILGPIIPTGYVPYKQAANIVDSNSINTTAAETLFTGTGIDLTIPSNTLAVGDRIKVKVYGTYGRTSGAIVVRFKNNAVTMIASPSLTLANVTAVGFTFEAIITIRSIGVGGTASVDLQTTFDNANPPNGDLTPSNGTKAINTTISQVLTFSAQWSISNAANTITIENADWEILKKS